MSPATLEPTAPPFFNPQSSNEVELSYLEELDELEIPGNDILICNVRPTIYNPEGDDPKTVFSLYGPGDNIIGEIEFCDFNQTVTPSSLIESLYSHAHEAEIIMACTHSEPCSFEMLPASGLKSMLQVAKRGGVHISSEFGRTIDDIISTYEYRCKLNADKEVKINSIRISRERRKVTIPPEGKLNDNTISWIDIDTPFCDSLDYC